MEFQECNSWQNPAKMAYEINLRFSTTKQELEEVYSNLPHDSLTSLEFKNMIGLILEKEPIYRMQTKYDLEQKGTGSACAVPVCITTLGTRNISIVKENNNGTNT
jgi:hypothetical protein